MNNFRKFGLTLGLLALGCVSFAETYGLCIGINDYPEVKNEKGEMESHDLKGCVNDATSMRDLMTGKFGVNGANVKLLTDKAATADGFLGAWRDLIAKAKPGDQIVFTYSGHGGQVEDKEESDGIQEVIVLADEKLVTGNLFGELAKTLTLNGVNCTFIFDSCYSGGMSRDVDGEIQVRTKSLGIIKPKAKDAISKVKANAAKFLPKQAAPTTRPTAGQSLFLFAGAENKPTVDISGLEGVAPHGLFTMLMLDIMEADAKTPVKDMYGEISSFLEQLNKTLKEKGSDTQFDQNPGFESSADRAALPILFPNK
ncbi:MAG: caspase family protein [Armatimonadetes bacterium]|nr:caspase family protein [Armatimonadota bacterium]